MELLTLPNPISNHNVFRAVASVQSSTDRVSWHAYGPCEVSGSDQFACHNAASSAPRVVHLLELGYPAAVPRFVVAVVFNPINLVLRRARPHIVKEVLKRLSPSITDRDATTTVVLEPSCCWSVTAIEYGSPGFVFTAEFATCRVPMCQIPRTQHIAQKATTTLDASALQAIRGRHATSATIAQAAPTNVFHLEATNCCGFDALHDRQSPKTLASKIFRVNQRWRVFSGFTRPALSYATRNCVSVNGHLLDYTPDPFKPLPMRIYRTGVQSHQHAH